LVEGGLDAWKLHLAGALTPGEEHAAYLADLRSAIGSLPIQLHVDLPAAQLRSLYSQSSIYWHAAGYGEDEQRAPIKFEHFGISTVEAMAAGSVPVVFAGGGQMELVESGSNGYAWRTLTELQQATLSLIRSPELCQQLARAAAKESERFSTSQFEQRLQAELTRIGYDGSPASALVQAAKQRER
jgi:glycosyltransferase involved in cell wall biosynthesis